MESGRQSRQIIESQRIRLAEAITNGRLYQTKMILTDFTDLNYLDNEGLSPLMRAFMIEDIKHRTRSAMVRLLIQHKVDVNLRDKYGQHVLNWACKMNKFDLVKLLLEKCLQDVELTSQDLDGNTPLMYAVINNNVNMVKLLVSALKKFSLSVDQRNNQDKTAYLKALEMGFNECASILSKVGKASQDIKVNPFLDFLPVPNTGSSNKIRARSAPLPKDYSNITQGYKDSKQFVVNQTSTCVNDSLFSGNRPDFTQNKKKSNSLLKYRKFHSDGISQKSQKENSKTPSHKTIKREKTKSAKVAKNDHNIKIFVQDEESNTRSGHNTVLNKNEPKNNLRTSREINSVAKTKGPFLRLLLDKSQSQSSSARHSPRRSVSYTSCNQTVEGKSRAVLLTRSWSRRSSQDYKPFLSSVNGYFTDKQPFDENNESHGKMFSSYHEYLVWKASLDYPPNSLPCFLALQAEQSSESSSYRKGITIPKYEPASDGSVYNRSVGAISPISERSGRSEAGRKISAVAKTVGLSIYLNKRKTSYKKITDANNSQ